MSEPIEQSDYMDLYVNFIKTYQTKETSGEEIGEVIARLASHFADWNLKLLVAERNLFLVAKDIENRTDESGKMITSAKAQVITNATDEAFERAKARTHLTNIEQFLNALKALQKGAINEYSHQ